MLDSNLPVGSIPGLPTFTTEADGLPGVFALSLNQDASPPSVGLHYSKNSVTENNKQFSLIFNLSQPAPTDGLRVVFSDIDSDDAFGDITSPPVLTNASRFESLDPVGGELTRSAITIAPGATFASLTWTTIADGLKEGKEITLTELQTVTGYSIDFDHQVDTLTILDTSAVRGRAIALAIQNAGFEDPVLEDFTFTVVPPPSWQVYNPDGLIPARTTDDSSATGVFNPSVDNYPAGVPGGNNVGYGFLVEAPGSGEAGLSQTLDARLVANTRYTLSAEVGNPTGDDPVPGISFPGFPGYRVELLSGGQVLAADNNSLAIAEGTFSTSTVTYVSSATNPLLGQPLEIRLVNLLQGPGIEVDFDDVQLTAQSIPRGSTRSHHLNRGLGELCDPLYKSSISEHLFTCYDKVNL